jgi:hypothetical protein
MARELRAAGRASAVMVARLLNENPKPNFTVLTQS